MAIPKEVESKIKEAIQDLLKNYWCVIDSLDKNDPGLMILYVFYKSGTNTEDYPKIAETMWNILGLRSNGKTSVRFVSSVEDLPTKLRDKVPVSFETGYKKFLRGDEMIRTGKMPEEVYIREVGGKISYFVPAEKSFPDQLEPETAEEREQRNWQMDYRQEQSFKLTRHTLSTLLKIPSAAKTGFEERSYNDPSEIPCPPYMKLADFMKMREKMNEENLVIGTPDESLLHEEAAPASEEALLTDEEVKEIRDNLDNPEPEAPAPEAETIRENPDNSEPEAAASEVETEDPEREPEDKDTSGPEAEAEDPGIIEEENNPEPEGLTEEPAGSEEELGQEEPSAQEEKEEASVSPEPEEAEAENQGEEPSSLAEEELEELEEDHADSERTEEKNEAEETVDQNEEIEFREAEADETEKEEPATPGPEGSGEAEKTEEKDSENKGPGIMIAPDVRYDEITRSITFDCDIHRPLVAEVFSRAEAMGLNYRELRIGENCNAIGSDSFLQIPESMQEHPFKDEEGKEIDPKRRILKLSIPGINKIESLVVKDRHTPLNQNGPWADGLSGLCVVDVKCGNDGIGNFTLEKGQFKYCTFSNPGLTEIRDRFFAGNLQNLCVRSSSQIGKVGNDAFNKLYDKSVYLENRKGEKEEHLMMEMGAKDSERTNFRVWNLNDNTNLKVMRKEMLEAFETPEMKKVRAEAAAAFARNKVCNLIFDSNLSPDDKIKFMDIYDNLCKDAEHLGTESEKIHIAFGDPSVSEQVKQKIVNKKHVSNEDFETMKRLGEEIGINSLFNENGTDYLNIENYMNKGSQVSWDISKTAIGDRSFMGQDLAVNVKGGLRSDKDIRQSFSENCDYASAVLDREVAEIKLRFDEVSRKFSLSKKSKMASLQKKLHIAEARRDFVEDLIRASDPKSGFWFGVSEDENKDSPNKERSWVLKKGFGKEDVFNLDFEKSGLNFHKGNQLEKRAYANLSGKEMNKIRDFLTSCMLNREGIGDLAFAFGDGPSLFEDEGKNREYQIGVLSDLIRKNEDEIMSLGQERKEANIELDKLGESSSQCKKTLDRLTYKIDKMESELTLLDELKAARAIGNPEERNAALLNLQSRIDGARISHVKDKDKPQTILERIKFQNSDFSKLVEADSIYLKMYRDLNEKIKGNVIFDDFKKELADLEDARRRSADLHREDTSGLQDISKLVMNPQTPEDIQNGWELLEKPEQRIKRYSGEIVELARQDDSFKKNALIKKIESDHASALDKDPDPKSSIDLLLEGNPIKEQEWKSQLAAYKAQSTVVANRYENAKRLEETVAQIDNRIEELNTQNAEFEEQKKKVNGVVEFGEGTHAWNGDKVNSEIKADKNEDKTSCIDRTNGMPEGCCYYYNNYTGKKPNKHVSNFFATGDIELGTKYMGTAAYTEKPTKKKERHVASFLVLHGTHAVANLCRFGVGCLSGAAVSMFMPMRTVMANNIMKILQSPLVIMNGLTFGVATKLRNNMFQKAVELSKDPEKTGVRLSSEQRKNGRLGPETILKVLKCVSAERKEKKKGISLSEREKGKLGVKTEEKRTVAGSKQRNIYGANCLRFSAANNGPEKEKEVSGKGSRGGISA